MKKISKRVIIICMVIVLFSANIVSGVNAQSLADRLQQAEQEKKEAENKKNQIDSNIDNLEGEQDTLKGQLHNLNNQLQTVSDNLEEIEAQINTKENEIATTQAELEESKKVEAWQYENLKKRIQFMYERGDTAYLELLFGAESFSEFLNYNEYVHKVAEYDKNKLDEYKKTRELIEATEARLQQEKSDLDTLREDHIAEQNKVSSLVSNTADHVAIYGNQIDAAEQEALAAEAEIKAKNELIAQIKKEIALSQLSANSVKRDISQVTFAEGDLDLLAALIYCEAGGEPYAGQLGVGAVVINRVLSSVYPDTMVGVIYARRQFSPVGSGRLAIALAEKKATPSCYQAAREAMSGQTNVGGCVYFRTPIEGLTGLQIGGHIFY